MKTKFILKGTIKCPKCNLDFLPNINFFDEIVGDIGHVGGVCELGIFCPDCDIKLKVAFKIEKITRELSKVYTMRC